MPIDLMPRVFYKGGSSSGSGKTRSRYSMDDYNEVKKQWETMLEMVDAVGMGTDINPIVREVSDLIERFEAWTGGHPDEEMIQRSYIGLSNIEPLIMGYASIDQQNFSASSTLGLRNVSANRDGMVGFLKYVTSDGQRMHGKYEYARDQLANMRTVMYRDERGNLRWRRFTDYKSNKHLAEEMRFNGYKVLNVWKGNKTDRDLEDWAWLHRKRY